MRRGVHIHSKILAMWIIDERWMSLVSETRTRKLHYSQLAKV
jgi:hypothetical protein